ncbi:MAG TPA: OmpA family protein [Bryobacteraceae bacterium]|jgi:peptidoglycan-associated lipoprotein|nr:OmpA family protein [Bryobacteraceae bacterium]
MMKTKSPLYFTLLLVVFAAGCSKKPPIPPPPPPPSSTSNAPAPPAPQRPTVAEFSVEPSSIERGQSAIVRWSVSNATEISIDNGIGTVQTSGTRRVIPSETTTYTLTASGPGGPTTATATITVTAPAPPPPPPSTTTGARGTLESRVQSDLQDALFDYDTNNIRDDARTALTADADALKRIFADFPTATVNVEGHCDERGSAEYNLGLGDRRATAARDFLVQLGVPADRLKTISYGKERPVCTESNESCWQRNRRAHFSTGQ